MKRFLIAATIVLALCIPATAIAVVTHHYHGAIDQGGTVDFATKKKNGKTKVKNFIFDAATAECADGTHHFSNPSFPFEPMRVRDGRFHGKIHVGPDGDIKVAGHFKQEKRKAKGTLKFTGDIASGPDCSSIDDWHAHRLGG